MTDENPVEEVADAGAEEVPEPVVTPNPEEEHHEERHDERPSFVDEILDHIDGIAERLAPASPVTPPAEDLGVVEETPPADTTPIKPPWTHRRLFGKR